jgi:hypothetical protein
MRDMNCEKENMPVHQVIVEHVLGSRVAIIIYTQNAQLGRQIRFFNLQEITDLETTIKAYISPRSKISFLSHSNQYLMALCRMSFQ